MPLPPWPEFPLFMALVLAICMYAVVVAGHFPREYRGHALKGPSGALFLWSTVVLAVASAGIGIYFAFFTIPWYAAVIGAGAMSLAAPLLVQLFTDEFVDGRASLLLLSVAAGAVAGGVLGFLI